MLFVGDIWAQVACLIRRKPRLLIESNLPGQVIPAGQLPAAAGGAGRRGGRRARQAAGPTGHDAARAAGPLGALAAWAGGAGVPAPRLSRRPLRAHVQGQW